ncbi:IstB-like ATP binding protein [Polaromonas sp. OV174]|nr:IstB-like ATP binding protein [Polaromonas sp. OV174]
MGAVFLEISVSEKPGRSDWRSNRGLSREVIASLVGGDWLRHGHNVLLTGATGCGKTWLACALGVSARP